MGVPVPRSRDRRSSLSCRRQSHRHLCLDVHDPVSGHPYDKIAFDLIIEPHRPPEVSLGSLTGWGFSVGKTGDFEMAIDRPNLVLELAPQRH